MDNLLTAIMLWLSANYDLVESYQHPQIEYVDQSDLVAFKTLELRGSARTTAHRGEPDQGDFAAIYDDSRRTIYLLDGWTGQTAADLSIVVHEMVHHLQSVGGETFVCPQQRERLAYRAQDEWLHLFGTDLHAEFGLDRMTLFVLTTCAY